MKCNHDCFHCKYPDCVSSDHIITPWESAVMKGAHGGWNFENRVALAARMMHFGNDSSEIILGLNVTSETFQKIRRAAKRLQPV